MNTTEKPTFWDIWRVLKAEGYLLDPSETGRGKTMPATELMMHVNNHWPAGTITKHEVLNLFREETFVVVHSGGGTRVKGVWKP